MGHQSTHQKKPAAPTRPHPTKTSVKSPVHPVEEPQAAIGNREMGRLMETNRLPHPSSPFPKLQGELPLLGGMMPVSQGTIQRQPLFRGLSQELTADTATLVLPATGAVIQPKLTLGTPGDMYEEEADRVARQVVDEIHSSPFREQHPQPEEEREPEVGEAGRVQRQITVRASGDAGGELSSEWEGELQRAKSGGQPLSPSVKEPMERAFGADFGDVRVHTGEQADRLARSIQAKAFTTGQDVFFRQGAYEPGSRRWEELLAHELTHVVQQGKTDWGAEPQISRDVVQRVKSLLAPRSPYARPMNASGKVFVYRDGQGTILARDSYGGLWDLTRLDNWHGIRKSKGRRAYGRVARRRLGKGGVRAANLKVRAGSGYRIDGGRRGGIRGGNRANIKYQRIKRMNAAQVMGGTANQTAIAAGAPANIAYEWCHLIAHGLGGETNQGNLVAASTYANTEMLLIESAVRAFRSQGQRIEVQVYHQSFNNNQQVAKQITYIVMVDGVEVYKREIDGFRADEVQLREFEEVAENVTEEIVEAIDPKYEYIPKS